MTLEFALRATEVMLALAVVQQSLEHLSLRDGDGPLQLTRLMSCVLLLSGVGVGVALAVLLACAILTLPRFKGPSHGGADKMSLLMILCLNGAHFAAPGFWQEMFLGYLALQLTLSYFISGRVKLVNAEWRSGQALRDVFAFSAYPVSQTFRGLANRMFLLRVGSWAVILFELAFPLSLLWHGTLYAALIVAGAFHLSNAVLFGLNRFFWIWLAAYPSLIWLQAKLAEALF